MVRTWLGIVIFVMISFTSIVLMVGCSSLPVGWGGTYKVLYKNEKVITIEYDELMSSYESILRVANEHCGSFSKVAIPTGPANTTRAGGALKTHTFKCE